MTPPDTTSAGRTGQFGTWVEFLPASACPAPSSCACFRLLTFKPIIVAFPMSSLALAACARVLNLRPFGSLGEHRRFFTGGMGGKHSDTIEIQIRIEHGDSACSSFERVPIELAEQLLWAFKNSELPLFEPYRVR
jgi:hypothetical protein